MATTAGAAQTVAGSDHVSHGDDAEVVASPQTYTHPSEHVAAIGPSVQYEQSQAAKAYTPAQAEEPFHDMHLPATYFHESLFQDDNTGTRKYKALLRGLKKVITAEYEPTDNPDIMPAQLSKFYEDLNGDYNQLFLETPSQSIAFIYKSLGCAYSLQPVSGAQRVEEPEVPALKTEGWIMWSTIQMLLGPDEHAGFLMDAVKKWDVVDPDTGKIFPKTIPRESFPPKADTRMVEWYEGVSERLKKEADEEAEERERKRVMDKHAEHRRITIKRDDEEDSLDSRGPALAYFRNPLYRHGDGRPSIVRHGPPGMPRPLKRPPISPRHSIVDRGKEAATAVGHVIRNVASPHLWDGGSNSSRERRRHSGASGRQHYSGEDPPQGSPYDDRLPVPGPGALRHQRHRSRNSEHVGSSPDDSWDSDQRSPTSGGRPHSRRQGEREQHSLRHSRSHDPTPSQKDYDDYFQQDDVQKPRRGSAFDTGTAPGQSFVPSSDLPMAAQIARQASRQAPIRADERRDGPGKLRSRSRLRFEEPRQDDEPVERAKYDERRHDDDDDRDDQARYDERPPADRSRRDERRLERRDRQDDQPRRDDPRRDERSGHERPRSRHDERQRREDRHPPDERRDPGRDRYDDRRADYEDTSRRRLSDTGSRRSASGRRSNASDLDSGYSGADDRERRVNKKQTRFAPAPISGVDGRRYVDQSPWQGQD